MYLFNFAEQLFILSISLSFHLFQMLWTAPSWDESRQRTINTYHGTLLVSGLLRLSVFWCSAIDIVVLLWGFYVPALACLSIAFKTHSDYDGATRPSSMISAGYRACSVHCYVRSVD
jgi:hypothetical protein